MYNFYKNICIYTLCSAAFGGTGCASIHMARPLEAGEHAVSLTAGGPLANVPGVGSIPLPDASLEVRHGLPAKTWTQGAIPAADIQYGMNLLPLVFGDLSLHVGGTVLLLDAPEIQNAASEGLSGLSPWVPSIAVGNRFMFATNRLDARKDPSVQADWGMWQIDLTASYRWYGQMLYFGVGNYLPFNDPNFLLTPFVGAEFRPIPNNADIRIQADVRYVAPYINHQFAVVDYIAPDDQGVIVPTVGLAWAFGAGASGGAQ